MKQIESWGLNKLHNEECFGYLKFVKTSLVLLPTTSGGGGDLPEVQGLSARSSEGASENLDEAMENFNEKFENFDVSLKESDVNPAVAEANELDAQRDKLWRTSRAYVKAMVEHPTATMAAAAGKVEDILDKYGDPTSLAQDEETGIIHNILADIEMLEEEDKEQSGIMPWYEKLAELQAAFEAADHRRAEISGSRTKGFVKQARKEAEAAYRNLVKVVNAAVLFNGEAPYAKFIDKINAKTERQGAISDRRDTLNAKKKEEEGEGDDRPVVQ